jgi:hypothetical protein
MGQDKESTKNIGHKIKKGAEFIGHEFKENTELAEHETGILPIRLYL